MSRRPEPEGKNMIHYPVNMTVEPEVQAFFDEATNTISYIVKDPMSNACAIVDSVMDIDYAAGRITYDHADELIRRIETQGLKLEWIIETHVHADHLSAAPYIQQKLGGKIGVGSQIMVVQETFGKVFNEGTEFQRDGSQFDKLFEDGDTYKIGNMDAFAIYTPGHTPACMVHVMCHDYAPNGRDIEWETTVGEEKQHNIHVGGAKSKEAFVKFRTERDAQLAMPRLIIPSLQVNMRAGEVPKDKDGNPMLKVPINAL
jgi:hypothetical protein